MKKTCIFYPSHSAVSQILGPAPGRYRKYKLFSIQNQTESTWVKFTGSSQSQTRLSQIGEGDRALIIQQLVNLQ